MITDSGITYTFDRLPQCRAELELLADFKNPRFILALLITAFKRYVENPEVGIDMINYLKGPVELSNYAKSFLKDRFIDKKYLPDSYFVGASVENNYTLSRPYKITVYNNTMRFEPSYMRVNVRSSGADSIRYLELREKNGNWYVWDYTNLVVGIRVPAAQNPWM